MPAAVFGLAAGFYLYTLQPSLSWGDGVRLQREVITGESFVLTEMGSTQLAPDPFPFARLGAAAWDHPLYVMLGHSLVGALKGADPLLLVNSISAFSGAAAVTLVFLLCRAHTGSGIASLAAALSLAVSHTFWFHSVTPEVYSLFVLLLLLALYLHDIHERAGGRWALIGGFFALGLAASNHLLAFLALPAAGVYLALRRKQSPAAVTLSGAKGLAPPGEVLPSAQHDRPRRHAEAAHFAEASRSPGALRSRSFARRTLAQDDRAGGRWSAVCSLAFLLGFSPYLIQFARMLRSFPLARVVGPAVGSVFLEEFLKTTPLLLLQSVFNFLALLALQFNPLGLALGLVGLWAGGGPFEALRSRAIAFFGVYAAFGILYRVTDQFAFFLTAYTFWALFIGMGLARLLGKPAGNRRRLLAGAFALTILGMPLFYALLPGLARSAGVTEASLRIPRVGSGFRDGLAYYINPNKRGDYSAVEFGRQTLAGLPPNALVIAEWFADTDEYLILHYFTKVEGLRSDVEVIGWPLEDIRSFDPAIAMGEIERALPARPVYLASLSDRFYGAAALVERYCIVPEANLYRVYPGDRGDWEGEGRDCVTEVDP